MFWLAQSISEERPSVWEGIAENFFSPVMAIRIGVVLFTIPIWLPIIRIMWKELVHSIDDASDDFAPARNSPEPPLDSPGAPFMNIPYAIYRQHGARGAKAEVERQERIAMIPQQRAERAAGRGGTRSANRGKQKTTSAPRGRGSRGRF